MRKNKFLNRVLALLTVTFLIIMNTCAYAEQTKEEILSSDMQPGEMMQALRAIGITMDMQQLYRERQQAHNISQNTPSMPTQNTNSENTNPGKADPGNINPGNTDLIGAQSEEEPWWAGDYEWDYYESGDLTDTGTAVYNVTTDEMNSILSRTGYNTEGLADATQDELNDLSSKLGEGYVIVFNDMNAGSKLYAGGEVIEFASNDTDVGEALSKTVTKLEDGTYLAIYKLPPTVMPEIPGPITTPNPIIINEYIPGITEKIPEYSYKEEDFHVTAGISPDKRNSTGENKLYSIGEAINLFGETCLHENNAELTYTTNTTSGYTRQWILYPNWEMEVLKDEEEKNMSFSKKEQSETISSTRESHEVIVELNGFKIDGKNKFTLLKNEEIGSKAEKPRWDITGKITEVTGKYENGARKGTIKVYCTCGENGKECCKKEMTLYFAFPITHTPSARKLTVKSAPANGGESTVEGNELDSTGKKFVKVTKKGNNVVFNAQTNSSYSISPLPASDFNYKRVATKDGNVIATKEDDGNKALYTMLDTPEDITLFVNFDPIDLQNGHKVEFIVEKSKDGKIHAQIDGKKILENIATGAKVPSEIPDEPKLLNNKIKTDSGWVIQKWYFTNVDGKIITPDTDGKSYFIMPDYDVQAHAVVTKSEDGYVYLTIKGDPENGGKVKLDNNVVEFNKPIELISGTKVKLEAIPNATNSYQFTGFTYENDQSIAGGDNNIEYGITGDTVIVAHFSNNNSKKYTLYVTSTDGGKSWANYKGKKYTRLQLYEGEEIEAQYIISEEGYEFKKWEYTPYINKKTEGNRKTKFRMPASDVTVTAIFEKNDGQPKLKVTTNNRVWGTAWTKDDKGNKTDVDTWTQDVTMKKSYKLYSNVVNNSYFVKWQYSTKKSPFVDLDVIQMPNNKLEVMAMFAPIPPQGQYSIAFEADPKEGGSVPDNLSKVKEGSKVTIGVTPNNGWKFDYWEIKDTKGNKKDVKIYYEKDGSGYFIMPSYNVEAIAHFSKDTYKLYITHTEGGTACTWDVVKNNPINNKTNDMPKGPVYIKDAIPGIEYPLYYKENPSYEFVGWEYRWDTYPNKNIKEETRNGVDYFEMPDSDLTVTAIFRLKTTPPPTPTGYKLRVTSNNYLWGTAFVKVDGEVYEWKNTGDPIQDIKESGIELKANKDYEVYFKEEDGYKFTNWIWTPNNGYGFNNFNMGVQGKVTDSKGNKYEYTGYGVINIPASNLNSDIELMAYFEPGKEDKYKLTVEIYPEEAGTVSGGGYFEEGAGYTVTVIPYDNYEFEYWYYIDPNTGNEIWLSDEETYSDGTMPDYPLTIIAYCEEKTIYTLQVINIGDGSGSIVDEDGNTVTIRDMYDGESIILNAIPDKDSTFVGYTVKGRPYPNNEFTINGEDLIVYAYFKKNDQPTLNNDEFKIISVRDLRWKKYFIDNKGEPFTIPQEGGTMLLDVGSKPTDKLKMNVLKMGYAVEFELTTFSANKDNTVLVITPELWDGSKQISWNKVKDYVASPIGKTLISDEFTKIVIYGDKNKESERAKIDKTKFVTNTTSAKVEVAEDISIDKTKWTWIYYLPADIGYDGYKSGKDEVTVKFNIRLYELSPEGEEIIDKNKKGNIIQDIVEYANVYKGVNWDGSVYKYSKTYSLLEDIYNNATN